MNKEEIYQYAEEIQRIWSLIFSTKIPDLPTDYPSITVKASFLENENILTLNRKFLSENSSKSVTFLSLHASWGGVDKDNSSQYLQDIMLPNFEKKQVKVETMQEVLKQQSESGNIWFGEYFFSHALNQVMHKRPDLIQKWLERAFTDDSEEIKYLQLASSFYEALCTVLLKTTPEQGIRLYWRIKEADKKICIQDEYSEIELLDYAFFQTLPSENTKIA